MIVILPEIVVTMADVDANIECEIALDIYDVACAVKAAREALPIAVTFGIYTSGVPITLEYFYLDLVLLASSLDTDSHWHEVISECAKWARSEMIRNSTNKGSIFNFC